MCFSATASFTAAAFLGVAGVATMSQANKKQQLPLALIPFLFAFQQLVEGTIWLSYADSLNFDNVAGIGKYLFLFVAILMWPVWISFALFLVEKVRIRKILLGIFLGIGIVYDLIILAMYFQSSGQIGVQIIGHSIQYQLPADHNTLLSILYLLATIVPPFLSSLRWAWLIGTANFLGFIVSNYLFEDVFISVWCFFAALISISVYFIFRDNLVQKRL